MRVPCNVYTLVICIQFYCQVYTLKCTESTQYPHPDLLNSYKDWCKSVKSMNISILIVCLITFGQNLDHNMVKGYLNRLKLLWNQVMAKILDLYWYRYTWGQHLILTTYSTGTRTFRIKVVSLYGLDQSNLIQ